MIKILKQIYRRPWIIMILTVMITIFSIISVNNNSELETNLDEYMPKNHPDFIYSNKAEDLFGIKDGVIFAIENKNGIFNKTTLEQIKNMSIELGEFEEIDEGDVVSLYTADNIIGSDFGLEIKPFYTEIPQREEELEDLKNQVLENDMIFKRLVSENNNVALIIAELEDDKFTTKLYEKLTEFSKKYDTEDNKIFFAGRPMVEGTLGKLAPKDMQKMIPIVILVIIAVLYLTLKSIKATVITFLIVALSTIWTFGLMTSLNIPIYSLATMIPVMLIAIGVADGIHLFNHIREHMKDNMMQSDSQIIDNMIEELYKPVIMTSITTAVGFISLITSKVYPVKYFGIFTAIGVLIAMFLSLIFLPAALKIIKLPKFKKRKTKSEKSKGLKTLTSLILKNSNKIFVGTIFLIILSGYGITKVWVDSSFLDKFEKDSEIVKADNFINKNFGGTTNLNIIFEGDVEDFKNPSNLRQIEKLQNQLEELKEVGNTFGLTDYIKRMNKVMNENKEENYTIPENQNLIAQYLLLYSMSGDTEKLDRVVDYNYERINLQVQLKGDNSDLINNVLTIIEDNRNKFTNIDINYAGSAYKAYVFSDLILEGQIRSLIMSLFIVIILISLMFKSLVAGIIGAIPITITALVNFGVMGFTRIPLSSTTALLSSIAVGIGIDYAIHFLERYRISALDQENPENIAQDTMAHTGKAILFNALVVVSGFSVLIFSVFPPNRELGILASMNMFVTFIITLTTMLVIINLVKPKFIFKSKLGGVKNEN